MKPNRICRSLIAALVISQLVSPLRAQIRLAAIGSIQQTDLVEKNSIPGFDTARGNYFSARTGFQLGVLAEIPLGKGSFFFQPGILYSAKGNQFERFTDTAVFHADTMYAQHTLKLNYVEIPLYMTWKLPLSREAKNHFFLSAGPYLAFIYGVSQTYQSRALPYNSTNYIYNSGTEDLPVGSGPGAYKTLDIGFVAKAGFEFGSVLLAAYFSRGLTNAYTASYPAGFHNQAFGGSLGIWLNKTKPVQVPVEDFDHDGTADRDDSCKTIAGFPRYHGCPVPDSDHDGINNELDSCPALAGTARYHGCPIPDTDQDGINDEEDSCISQPGTSRYHGCPVPDRDQDGVNDEQDKCPDLAGPVENNGCPPPKAEIVNSRALIVSENVVFQTNRTHLTRTSYPAIKEIADSLKANPDLELFIAGHTDNSGGAAFNQKLSFERAASVKKVLINLGVPGDRITAEGFGDTKPVADNHTTEGRAKNRRVVFTFQLKKR